MSLLTSNPASCQCAWEAVDERLSSCHPKGDLDGAPGSCRHPSTPRSPPLLLLLGLATSQHPPQNVIPPVPLQSRCNVGQEPLTLGIPKTRT